MNRKITDRVAELRSVYVKEMGAMSRAHSRGKIAESRSHYAKALAARDEMNALGFDLFGPLANGGAL